jgi:hypothetical protein
MKQRCLKMLAPNLFWLLIIMASCRGQSQNQARESPSGSVEAVTAFLRGYLKTASNPDDETTRYFNSFVDLNNDRNTEAVVYLVGESWCGSGGCTLLLLTPQGSTYRVIARVPTVRPPVQVLSEATNGWRNITVRTGNGGSQGRSEAELRFDGETYVKGSARVSPSASRAEIIITEAARDIQNGTPLYP